MAEENTEVKSEVKKSSIADAMGHHENTLQQEVALKAVGLVKPMLIDAMKELGKYLGNNDKIVVLRRMNNESNVAVVILDTHMPFRIIGGEKFIFGGDPISETDKTPKALVKNYDANEFIDMLLSGRMKELTEKLMK